MSLTDEGFVEKLQQMDPVENRKEMWALIKACGGIGRLIALAARGLPPKPKAKAVKAAQAVRTRLPADFPDQAMKDRAVVYWGRKRRPDLQAAVEHEVEKFRDHHTSKGTRAESWPATWSTWASNALEFVKPPRPGDTGHPSATLAFEQCNEAGWYGRVRGFYEGGYWKDTWGAKPPAAPHELLPPDCKVPLSVMKKWNDNQRRAG